MYVDLIQHKLDWEIWKRTCDLLKQRLYLNNLSNRQSFPLKDPGQDINVNIVIGEDMPSYDSSIHFKIKKLPSAKKGTSRTTQRIHMLGLLLQLIAWRKVKCLNNYGSKYISY